MQFLGSTRTLGEDLVSEAALVYSSSACERTRRRSTSSFVFDPLCLCVDGPFPLHTSPALSDCTRTRGGSPSRPVSCRAVPRSLWDPLRYLNLTEFNGLHNKNDFVAERISIFFLPSVGFGRWWCSKQSGKVVDEGAQNNHQEKEGPPACEGHRIIACSTNGPLASAQSPPRRYSGVILVHA
jgi:hypothetical protein